MGCGCGRRRRAGTGDAQAMAAMSTPPEPSPFVLLTQAGWRPAGSGQWRRGDEVTTTAKALAALDLERVVAAAQEEVGDATA